MRRACVVLSFVAACTREPVGTPASATSTAAPVAETRPEPAEREPIAVATAVPEDPPPAEPSGTETVRVITLVPENGELAEQLATAASRARADGLVPVVEMWASWCPPCRKLDGLLADAGFAAQLHGLALVRLDSDAWGDALDEAGFDAPTIPTFYAVDATGRPKGKPLLGHKWGKIDADGIAAKLRALAEP